jgi:hypothetical protein
MRYWPIAAALLICVLLGLLSGCDLPQPVMCMGAGEVGEVVTVTPGERAVYSRYGDGSQATTTVKVRMLTGGAQRGTVRICQIDGVGTTPYQPGDRVNLIQMARVM